MNSTCFSDELVNSICDRAKAMKKGSWFLAANKHFKSDDWLIVKAVTFPASWGPTMIHIHLKLQ